MTARERLAAALLVLAEHGYATPCQGRRRERWTSDDRDERQWAASVCVGLACPVLEECRDTGAEEKHTAGVWGAVDRASGKRVAS